MTPVSDRVIVVVDTLLVCLGLTMTVAALGPLLELASPRMWRRVRPLRSREKAPAL